VLDAADKRAPRKVELGGGYAPVSNVFVGNIDQPASGRLTPSGCSRVTSNPCSRRRQ
jgi:hypothetical protein